MIRSMTGFGEAERAIGMGRLRVEIRTVNHRFLNTSVRTPRLLDDVQSKLSGWIREHVSRGHATISLTLESEEASERREPLPELDLERARHRVELLRRMGAELGLDGPVTISDVVGFGDVFREPEPEETTVEVDHDAVRAVVDEAARALVRMREDEGRRLRADMQGRLDAILAELDRVDERAPERLHRERARLREAVEELTGKEEIDEDRLAREIVYLAERWDVNEEVVRFRSHVELFGEALDSASEEAVGKRLSFLVQEMHREANTIGSKANDAHITASAVTLKEEVERLREQVENVE